MEEKKINCYSVDSLMDSFSVDNLMDCQDSMFIKEFLLNSHVHDSIYPKQICSEHKKSPPILFNDMDQNLHRLEVAGAQIQLKTLQFWYQIAFS